MDTADARELVVAVSQLLQDRALGEVLPALTYLLAHSAKLARAPREEMLPFLVERLTVMYDKIDLETTEH